VLPLVAERLPVKGGAENNLLLGFSKSGWGAWSLLLRHPDRFSRAAAWDAPLAMASPTKYGMQGVFATQENFEPYQITTALERNVAHLKGPARLGLFGYGNFRDQHVTVHDRLVEMGIPHEYRDGPKREHTWSSGWVTEAVEWLVEER
jgi:S-formylglutathione hydrolase FrmB